jgi:hypothetical protein
MSIFQASDQIQKFKVTFCDLEGFGGSTFNPFEDWSAENSRKVLRRKEVMSDE